jgi:hypothetical protein
MTDMSDHTARREETGVTTIKASPSTRYVSLRGRFYMRPGLALSRAWLTLWSQQEDFLGSEGKSVGERSRGRLLSLLLRVRNATALTILYVRASRRAGQDASLELPVRGEFALVRRSGAVKVLDVERARVLTLMKGPEWRTKLEERVKHTRRLTGRPFAPKIGEVALEEGWFSEEFVPGRHPTGFSGCFSGFGRTYLPLLAAFLRAEPPQTVGLVKYASRLADDILDPNGLLTQMPAEAHDTVRRFVTDIRVRLTDGRLADRRLPLVLSHGDFFSGNVVLSRNGSARAIDWAHVGSRSPTHDLYYLVMNHCVRVMRPDQQRERLQQMLSTLRERVENEDPERFAQLDGALTTAPEWRWLFYLECIQVPLERCHDPSDRYLTAMLERVARFMAYERAVAGLDRTA